MIAYSTTLKSNFFFRQWWKSFMPIYCLWSWEKKDNRMSFLDVSIICEQGKFTTSTYHKPTFSGIYARFDYSLPSTYKIGMIHTLLCRCYLNCSDWAKLLLELAKLMDASKNTGYCENFINNCFKVFLDNKCRIQGKLISVPKKPLFLVFPYLGSLSLQARTKWRKFLKGIH